MKQNIYTVALLISILMLSGECETETWTQFGVWILWIFGWMAVAAFAGWKLETIAKEEER